MPEIPDPARPGMPGTGGPTPRPAAGGEPDPGGRAPSGIPGAPTSAPPSRLPSSVPEPVSVKSDLPESQTLARELIREPVESPIRIIFLDVDGTLTDGVIGYSKDVDFRHFWIRDGIALEWARGLGVMSVAISGRDSESVVARMRELGVEYHGNVEDKVAVAQKILEREGADWKQCVMVGDDLPDLALMRRVGWPIAVGNAQPEIKLAAKTVLGTHGGHGAVREAVEMVLRHNGTWDRIVARYEGR